MPTYPSSWEQFSKRLLTAQFGLNVAACIMGFPPNNWVRVRRASSCHFIPTNMPVLFPSPFPTPNHRRHPPTGRDRVSSTAGRHLTTRIDLGQSSRRKGQTAPPRCSGRGSASVRCARFWTRGQRPRRPLLWHAGGTAGERDLLTRSLWWWWWWWSIKTDVLLSLEGLRSVACRSSPGSRGKVLCS